MKAFSLFALLMCGFCSQNAFAQDLTHHYANGERYVLENPTFTYQGKEYVIGMTNDDYALKKVLGLTAETGLSFTITNVVYDSVDQSKTIASIDAKGAPSSLDQGPGKAIVKVEYTVSTH